MAPQVIRTEGDSELVVLTRRDYDALLARLGDEEAEDRMAARLVGDARAALADGRETVLPDWLAKAIIAGDSPIRAARLHAGMTQVDLAQAAGIGQGYLSEIENGAKRGTDDLVARIAEVCAVQPAWLRS